MYREHLAIDGLLKIGTFVQADYPEAQKDAADVTS